MARSEARKDFDVPTRLRLLEQDADEIEGKYDRIGERLGKIMVVCVSILTALVGSLVLLVLNLATGG